VGEKQMNVSPTVAAQASSLSHRPSWVGRCEAPTNE
jgi:hypothetical protein